MLTPQQHLENLIDSIKTADDWYDEDHPVVFATEKQVKAINIAMQKIVKGIKRADRIALLAKLCGRKLCFFASSKDMTTAGANALIGAIYGEAENLQSAPMDQERGRRHSLCL